MEYAKILYIMARELGITDNFVKKKIDTFVILIQY